MKRRWYLIALAALLIFGVGYVGVLDKNDQSMQGLWTFWKGITLRGPLVVGTSADTETMTLYGAITQTGAYTVTGDVSVTGQLSAEQAVVHKIYDFASAAGTLVWAYTNGNIIMCSGTTASAITLPAITAATDGYVLTVKNVSGATTRTLTPNNADYIECTQGTMTGTSCATIDAAGDMIMWVADYVSGASGVWRMIAIEVA